MHNAVEAISANSEVQPSPPPANPESPDTVIPPISANRRPNHPRLLSDEHNGHALVGTFLLGLRRKYGILTNLTSQRVSRSPASVEPRLEQDACVQQDVKHAGFQYRHLDSL